MNVIAIGPLELALASGFILISGGLAFWLQLGLTRPLLIATIRTYLQLFALGYVLKWIFGINHPALVMLILATMLLTAGYTILSRQSSRGPWLITGAFTGIFLSGLVVTFTVTGLIVQVHPWFKAQYVLPIGGMVIGNSMNGIAVATDRLFQELKDRRGEAQLRLSLGASPWEAVHPMVRNAFRTGMIPTLNSMATVGLVFIPGMMTGQVLAGSDPTVAAGYQIVVMLMISASTALGTIISLFFAYKHAYDAHGCLKNHEPNRDSG